MLVVHHYYSTSLYRRSATHERDVLNSAKQILHHLSWVTVRLDFGHAPPVDLDDSDLDELENWVHWDGSSSPAWANQPNGNTSLAGDDASAEADTGFMDVETETEEADAEGVSNFFAGSFDKFGVQQRLNGLPSSRTQQATESVSDSDSDAEARSFRDNSLRTETGVYAHTSFPTPSPSLYFPPSQSSRMNDPEIVDDSLILDSSRVVEDGQAGGTSFSFQVNESIPWEQTSSNSHPPIQLENRRRISDDSVTPVDSSSNEVNKRNEHIHDDDRDKEDSALDTAFFVDDETPKKLFDKLPLPNSSSAPAKAMHAPLLPHMLVPPPRLQSSSPRKRLLTKKDHPIFSPPKRIIAAQSSPIRRKRENESQEQESQPHSDILDPDDFSIPRTKKFKPKPTGEWDGDEISEWHDLSIFRPNTIIKEETDLEEENGMSFVQHDLPLSQDGFNEGKGKSDPYLLRIFYPRLEGTIRRYRFDKLYYPEFSKEDQPDMKYGVASVGIIFEHPFVTLKLWNKLLEVRQELGVGVAFCDDEDSEGGGYVKVYVDAPLRFAVRRRVREWENVDNDGRRIRMRLVDEVNDDIDEDGWK